MTIGVVWEEKCLRELQKSLHELTATSPLKKKVNTVHLHCKKSYYTFSSPAASAGKLLTKLSLSGNNLIIPDQGEFGR
jgi:hypothetical protein